QKGRASAAPSPSSITQTALPGQAAGQKTAPSGFSGRGRGGFYASVRMAPTGQASAAATAWGTSSPGMSPGMATARVPSIEKTSGHRPAHWVQPMQRLGSTIAFMALPPLGRTVGEYARQGAGLYFRRPVWYNSRKPGRPRVGPRRDKTGKDGETIHEHPDLWHQQELRHQKGPALF